MKLTPDEILSWNETKFDFINQVMEILEFSDSPIIYEGIRNNLSKWIYSLAKTKKQKETLNVLL